MQQRAITSKNNPAIRRLRSLMHAHRRRKSDTFLIEGPKFIRDAVSTGIEFVTIVVSGDYKGDLSWIGPGTRLLRVSGRLYRELSDTTSPQGLIAEAKCRWSGLKELGACGKHLLVAWGVQDPGNMGTTIRSSAAFGMGGVIVGRGSADPFSSKALRASAGAVLRHPLSRATKLGKLVKDLHCAGYSTCWMGTQARMPLKDVSREGLLAIFIGSEGKGLSEKDCLTIGDGIRVPIDARVESLNAGVAASIVAYELARLAE